MRGGFAPPPNSFKSLLIAELETLKDKLLSALDEGAPNKYGIYREDSLALTDIEDREAHVEFPESNNFKLPIFSPSLEEETSYASNDGRGTGSGTDTGAAADELLNEVVNVSLSSRVRKKENFFSDADSECSGRSGMARPSTVSDWTSQGWASQLTTRKDWVLDNNRLKYITLDEAMPTNELTSALVAESDRVMHELRYTDSWFNQVEGGDHSHDLRSTTFLSRLSSASNLSRTPSNAHHGAPDSRNLLPLNPHSMVRCVWDMCGLFLVSYDAVMIPFLLMVAEPEGAIRFILPLVTNIFWSMDIVINFSTATTQGGELNFHWGDIAYAYGKSWFPLDLAMVLPEWIFLLMTRNRAGSAMLRILKIFRSIRLIRLVKIVNSTQVRLSRINSESLMNLLNLLQLILAFLMLNHFMACAWYFTGRTTGDGWFAERGVSSSSEGYLLALHWCITQFHGSTDVAPGNSSERKFAVVALVIGIITASVFVSFITDMVFRTRQARQKHHEQTAKMRGYFIRHDVSTRMMLSVKTHLQRYTDMDKDFHDDKEVLEALPPLLQRSLLLEVRLPIIENHWLFNWIFGKHFTAFREICYAAWVSTPVLCGHSVFAFMDACNEMYFVESGMLRYLPRRDSSGQHKVRESIGPESRFVKRVSRLGVGVEVSKKRWICEPALWFQGWQTHGELIATANSILLCLESSSFAKVISSYPTLHFEVAMYVHWVFHDIKDSSWEMVDLWAPVCPDTTLGSADFADTIKSLSSGALTKKQHGH